MKPSPRARGLGAALPAAALLAALGCGGSEPAPPVAAGKTTSEVSTSERSGRDDPADLSPLTARLRLGTVKLGSELTDEGDVAPDAERDDFAPGDPVFAAIALGDVGVGSALLAEWIGPRDSVLHQETATVPERATHLAFRAPDTATWEPGSYRVEIRIGDEVGARRAFELRPAPEEPAIGK